MTRKALKPISPTLYKPENQKKPYTYTFKP